MTAHESVGVMHGSGSRPSYRKQARDLNSGASRSRTVAGTCPQVSDRLLRRPREYEIDRARVL